jgi:hypothetical protein
MKTMKVIATTTGGYLCELSRQEAHLLGHSSINIGDEIPLDRAFETLTNLRGISRTNLVYLGDQITKLQTKFKDVEEMYSKVMLLDSMKNNEAKQ